MAKLDVAAPALLNHQSETTRDDVQVLDAPIARVAPHLVE
jgi:hypothetical protein